MAPSRHPIGRGKTRVYSNCLLEQRERFVDAFLGSQIVARHSAQIVVISVEAFRWFALRARHFGLLQSRSNGAHNARSNLVLQIEDVLQRTFKAISPEVCAG